MRTARFLLPALPFAMLSVAVPLVDRVEPRIAGFPFVLVWLMAWVALTPVCLLIYERTGQHR